MQMNEQVQLERSRVVAVEEEHELALTGVGWIMSDIGAVGKGDGEG